MDKIEAILETIKKPNTSTNQFIKGCDKILKELDKQIESDIYKDQKYIDLLYYRVHILLNVGMLKQQQRDNRMPNMSWMLIIIVILSIVRLLIYLV